VKDASLRKLHHQVTSLIGALPFPVELRHVTREQNRDADRLANVAIDTKRSVQEVTPDALARSALG
jgi:ribonuclease HI